MCSLHGCCDHGIHSERNTPNWRHGPDSNRAGRPSNGDSVFGAVGAQTTVSQPREVTRLRSRPERPDRRERRDNALHLRSDSHMNSRPDHSTHSRVSDSNSNIKNVHVEISGKVHGLSYRRWTVENATKMGLNGWVRNCKDGTVEAVFSSKPSRGSHAGQVRIRAVPARVANVAVTPAAGPPKKGFEQLGDKRW